MTYDIEEAFTNVSPKNMGWHVLIGAASRLQ